jgi:hypothetical protein
MTRKTFKHDIPIAIIGMEFHAAKLYCLSEGYQLYRNTDTIHLNETYVITISKFDNENKILEAKYGF